MSAGMLPVTQVFAVTPDNLARHFYDEFHVRVPGGSDLPMLSRVLNYAHLSLEELRQTALNDGRNGVKQDRE